MKLTRNSRHVLLSAGLLGALGAAQPPASLAHAVWEGRSHDVAAPDAELSGKADVFLMQRAAAYQSAQQAAARRPGAHTLTTAAPPAPVAAILQLVGTPTAAQLAQLTPLKVTVTQSLPLINALAVQVPTANLNAVSALTWVKRISLDAPVQKYKAPDEDIIGHTLANIATQQYGLTGQGVFVGVLDSGISANPDLNGRTYNIVSMVPGDPSMDDKCGHGTHVAGIIGGNGTMSSGPGFVKKFTGIAPQSTLVNIRVLDQNGQGSVSQVVAGIEYALQAKAAYNYTGAGVLNLSLGHPVGESYTTDPLCQAVEAAWKAGLVVVCSAGNSGRTNATQTTGAANEGWGTAYGSINSPGNDPMVITVGAMKNVDGLRAHDTIATYSSRGPTAVDMVLKPDIIAPGNLVVSLRAPGSTFDQEYGGSNTEPVSDYGPSTVTSSNYFVLSGTSMAAPVVSGAVALMLQKNPTLSPDTVKARLMVSADKWTDTKGNYDPFTYGAGYLDIPAALNCTVVAGAPALSPPVVQDAQGNVEISNVIWGSHVVWGSSSINDLHVVWGSNIVTGSNVIWGSHVVWGSSVWSGGVSASSAALLGELSGIAALGE